MFLTNDIDTGKKVNELPKIINYIIKIIFNRLINCPKVKMTLPLQISIIIFTLLYPPKAIWFTPTAQDERKLQKQQ